MQPQAIHLIGVAPIPVGHRVDVRFYAFEEGLFSKSWVPYANPLITDLDTGVVYGDAALFKTINMYRAGQVMPDLPITVRPEAREQQRLQGRVTACRVAWIGSGDTRYPQTTLLVSAEQESPE